MWSFAFLLLATSAVALPQASPLNGFNDTHTPSKWIPAPTNGTDQLNKVALRNTEAYLRNRRNTTSTCTSDQARHRREWDSLDQEQRRGYILAVQCLHTKPSISGDQVPGARHRYDDFVGVHINQTRFIHSTANFLTWHRYFVYTYEEALRNECGYQGPLPYIEWGRYKNDMINAPLFDGSETSIGGNGGFVPNRPYMRFPSANNSIVDNPPHQGGGCITSGPFKDLQVHLGPLALVGVNVTTSNPRKDGLGYNPRCRRRDFAQNMAVGASDANTTKLIVNNNDIASFQDELQGPFNYGVHEYGVHTAGHFMTSGDPGSDFFVSAGDPWFFLHHAQIDRVYWMWQMNRLDKVQERLNSISGTITMLNDPPSRNGTLDDRFDLGVNDGFKGVTIRETLSTVDGPFCYVYE